MRFPYLNRRRVVIGGGVIGIAAMALAVAWVVIDPLGSRARRQWKDEAIAKIQRRLDDKAWLDSEVPRLKGGGRSREGAWVGEELLVAKNGEWMVCQSVCAKEQKTAVRKDLFIGRGSDGKWYYSTFHFCVGKCVLQGESQPGSLAQLVDGYWLVPFDGKSNECLKVTWHGEGLYGQAKWQGASGGNGPQ